MPRYLEDEKTVVSFTVGSFLLLISDWVFLSKFVEHVLLTKIWNPCTVLLNQKMYALQ